MTHVLAQTVPKLKFNLFITSMTYIFGYVFKTRINIIYSILFNYNVLGFSILKENIIIYYIYIDSINYTEIIHPIVPLYMRELHLT